MAVTAPLSSQLLTAQEAADLLGTTPATLAVWRCRRTVQIPYVRLGTAIRYRALDIESYIDAQTVGGSAQ